MIPTNDKVIVKKADVLDDWGRPIEIVVADLGSTTEQLPVTEYKCRIDYRTEVFKNDKGEEVVSKAVILIKGVALVTTNDTIKWSDSFGEHEAKPLSVSPLKDFSSKVLFTKVVV